MANNVKNPDALNTLLKEILLNLFDQAKDDFETRTGRKVEMTRLQKLKYDGARKLVGMGMKHLDRFGSPEQKFERFVNLSNAHLGTVVDVAGEEAVIMRLRRLPDNILNAEMVRDLESAGAREIAGLLAKALPEDKRPVAAATVAAAVAAPVAATIAVSQAPKEAVAATIADMPAGLRPVDALRRQLSMMKEFEAQVRASIADLEEAIAAEEGKAAPAAKAKGPQPG